MTQVPVASVIIPTYNAANHLPLLLEKLNNQTLLHELIIIDSGSVDGTQKILSDAGIAYKKVNKGDFNHGGTRNLGLKLAKYETVIYLTQDALPSSVHTLEKLVSALYINDQVAMAYGRQLPYQETDVFGKIARLANYPATSLLKTKKLISSMGIKTCSCSNSFAAYRKSVLLDLGGFPENIILGEDVSVGAKFILSDMAISYAADACVYHSHDYSLLEEFKRYFDIGVFHEQQQSVLREFTKAESEGFKYVIEEGKLILSMGKFYKLPEQMFRVIAKYVGYRAGRSHEHFPLAIKKKFSMHKSFWVNQ